MEKDCLVDIIQSSNLSANEFLITIMIILFIAGFFIDFIEIIFIFIPIILPLLKVYDMNPLWIAIFNSYKYSNLFSNSTFCFFFFLSQSSKPSFSKNTSYVQRSNTFCNYTINRYTLNICISIYYYLYS